MDLNHQPPGPETEGRILNDFIEEQISIVVKALYIGAGENEKVVRGAADIEIGRVSAINLAEIADGDGGLGSLAVMDNSLNSKGHASRFVGQLTLYPGMRIWLCADHQFHPRCNRQIQDFVDARLRRQAGRVSAA